MAKVQNPFLSTKAIGSFSGLTAAVWKGIPVMRRKGTPAHRARTTQPRNRALIGFLARRYGTLSDAQRDLWENYALNHPQDDGFGGTFIMSGQNAYVMLNHSAVRVFGVTNLQVTPPTQPPQASLDYMTVATGATDPGDIDLAWSEIGTPSDVDRVEIRIAGPFQSPARQEVHARYRFIKAVVPSDHAHTETGLVENTWYWFIGRYLDRFGQTTAWHTGQATPKLTP